MISIVKNIRSVEITEEMRETLLQLEIDMYQDMYDLNPANHPKYSDISEFSEDERIKLWAWFDDFQENPISHQKFIIHDQEERVVGTAEYHIIETGSQYILRPTIKILRKFQRQGYGRSVWQYLLDQIPSQLDIEIRASVTIERGKRFIESLGFEPLVEQVSSFLYRKNARWNCYQQWVEDAPRDKFSTMVFRECPKDIIEEFCEIYNKIKSYSHSRLVYGLYKIDPTQRRENEKKYGMETGYDWSTIIVQDRRGKILGLTETYVDLKEEGKQAYQELTGVLPDYRGLGLAKWMKGLMMFRLRKLYPQLETIRVSNWRGVGDDIPAILSLNRKMGYEELFSTGHYLLKV